MAKKKSKELTEKEVENRQSYKKLKVNFWRTKLHSEELGIYQEMKYMAKTRLFSKNFDIEGVIEEDGEKKYIIAFNKDEWQERKDDDPVRLILRIFTIMEEGTKVGSGGNFHGGFELSITHSLIQSYEVKRPAPVFFINLPRDPYLYRVVRGWRLKGTRWTFPLLPEKKEDKFQIVTAKGVVGLGRDYDIFIGKKKIAKLDHQKVTNDVMIDIYDEDYSKDVNFIKMLLLFACMCKFMKEAEDMIDDLYKKMKDSGTSDYTPDRYELDLFKNPRYLKK